MIDSLSALQARMSGLDATLRSIDPSWQGLSATAGTTGTAVPFDVILASTAATAPVVTHATAGAGPSVVADAGASPGLPIGGGASIAASALASVQTARPAISADDRVVSPVPGSRISQDFGPTSFTGEPSATVNGVHYAHYHDGVDYAAPLGRPVRAIAAGTVVGAGRVADGAVIVRIRHADGSESLYGHLDPDLGVRVGDKVAAGERIGAIGMTGHTTGPHLHLELRWHDRAVDPQRWIDAGRLPGARVAATAPSPASPAMAAAAGSVGADDLARFDELAPDIPYAPEIRAAALKAGIDPLLLTSVVKAESGFRANAVSRAGALGLGQLMPATAKSMGVKDPFDPATNVAAAARYLANNLRMYGRTDLALAAYQAGKGAVARAGGIPESPTTHHYIDRILGYWSHYIKEADA